MEQNSYEQINDFRLRGIAVAARDNEQLNEFHDLIYGQIILLALERTIKEHGTPPSPFAFFVMGSAGRHEQSIWSDQDHGLVFEHDTSESRTYFRLLGSEISNGLHICGYPKCPGGVMAENALWNNSLSDWKKQLLSWSVEPSWEAVRYLLIFADARCLYGRASLLSALKDDFFFHIETFNLIHRLLKNTMHVKKGIGVLGQLLVETHGLNSGSINLKDTAFFPYVNSARLLAIKERILDTSTLARLTSVSGGNLTADESEYYKGKFSRLLDFRLHHGNHFNYDSGHYVSTDKLTRAERKELKEILKAGEQLYAKVLSQIGKEKYHEHE